MTDYNMLEELKQWDIDQETIGNTLDAKDKE